MIVEATTFIVLAFLAGDSYVTTIFSMVGSNTMTFVFLNKNKTSSVTK